MTLRLILFISSLWVLLVSHLSDSKSGRGPHRHHRKNNYQDVPGDEYPLQNGPPSEDEEEEEDDDDDEFPKDLYPMEIGPDAEEEQRREEEESDGDWFEGGPSLRMNDANSGSGSGLSASGDRIRSG